MQRLNQRFDRFGWSLPVLAVTTGVVTYFLIVLGSTVRVTNSGMGCPGWPLCYGEVGPIDAFHSLLEQSHRYVVSLVTLLVLLTALAAWRYARQRRSVLIPATGAVGVIIIQIILGAITVFTHNAPYTVALHLLMALVVLAVVWLTAIASLLPFREAVGRRLSPLAYGAVASTFILMFSGSLVVDGNATLACPSWPVCGLGTSVGPVVALQYAHRFMVLVTTILIGAFAMHAARHWRDLAGARLVADFMAILLVGQIAVGGVVATTGAPVDLQDLHLALAAAIWALVVCLAAIGWQAAADSRGRVGAPASAPSMPTLQPAGDAASSGGGG